MLWPVGSVIRLAPNRPAIGSVRSKRNQVATRRPPSVGTRSLKTAAASISWFAARMMYGSASVPAPLVMDRSGVGVGVSAGVLVGVGVSVGVLVGVLVGVGVSVGAPPGVGVSVGVLVGVCVGVFVGLVYVKVPDSVVLLRVIARETIVPIATVCCRLSGALGIV